MIKFGTGGWRAIIADGFIKENIRLLTAGLCALMEKEGYAGAEICVGYDRRFLSRNLRTGRVRCSRATASARTLSTARARRRSSCSP